MSENDTAADNQAENFKAKRDKKKCFCVSVLHCIWSECVSMKSLFLQARSKGHRKSVSDSSNGEWGYI